MDNQHILVLDKQQISQKIDRIAYQLLEDNFDETEIIMAGIIPGGFKIANRIKAILDEIAPFRSSLIGIQLDKHSSSLKYHTEADIQACRDKVVVLVDDVLNSGKALAYGMGVFLNIPLKKLRTVVLVDRNHKSFPMNTDYAGIALSTLIQEHVSGVLDEPAAEDAVYLV